MSRRPILRRKIEKRLAEETGNAFLTREFLDLGSERQVYRVLQELVKENRLMRLGYGVYGRTRVSRLSGKPILDSPQGLTGIGREVLTKLGIKWDLTDAQRAYNERRSTQVPANPAIRVIDSRFSRRLREDNWELRLDR